MCRDSYISSSARAARTIHSKVTLAAAWGWHEIKSREINILKFYQFAVE